MSDVAQETLTKTRQMDPLWEKLMRLPFFVEADMGEKRQVCREEQEREERKKEQEREEQRKDSKPRSPHVYTAFLPSCEEKTKMDKYLSTCERLLDVSKVDQEVWVSYILPKLPARTIYNRMPADRANVYQQLKRLLLNSYAISPFVYRQNFFGWKKRVACSYTEYLGEIEEHLDMWLHCPLPNGQEPNWRELLLRYRLDQQFLEEVAMHLADKNIVTVAESADLADEYLVQRKIYAKTTSQRYTVERAAKTPADRAAKAPAERAEKTPGREGREDPSREGRENPSRKGREDPSREGREDPSREGRKDPNREGKEEEDFLVLSEKPAM
ncbi:hypothetical protein CAPTEDRAFT_192893 [Capitella teleta]|uniref:Uncharacterized protein n=1 Tax=Capitella teleta TaxID=283909 RepID=R7TX77_CAPTE|nr:hypothetical protein CAPTEDRAFT_192893 [Capitella teleta]|eukprot:ELT98294.1 hypothetical protein CAPTEDRAFT_192893 [Capitella teleta]